MHNTLTRLPSKANWAIFLGISLLSFLILAPEALAHVTERVKGISYGFKEGFYHPLGGLDHSLAMISVGLWAGQIKNPNGKFLVPAAFAGVMVIGAFLGLYNIPVPFPEQGIALSVLVLGLLVATAFDLNVLVGMAIVAAFGICHGSAHGTEFVGNKSAFMYFIGFCIATVGMHVFGVFLSHGLQLLKTKGTIALRLTGVVVSVMGVWLLVKTFA